MAIRPAHTVAIIQKRLKQAEMSDRVDGMELIGIYDELSRVERKWVEKAADLQAGKPSVRPLSDADQMNERFDRLRRLIDAALRKGVEDAEEARMLGRIAETIARRKPLNLPD